ncbi:hypothetical protein Cs7R123_06180 [Catellatospora sp. TT07R-123]|nr:hypothetical protein Cs7R123_06180 [Catellatospora sp. TT07R-123]
MLILKFMPNYLFHPADFAPVPTRQDPADDEFLFRQGPARGLGAVRFHDWRTAYDRTARQGGHHAGAGSLGRGAPAPPGRGSVAHRRRLGAGRSAGRRVRDASVRSRPGVLMGRCATAGDLGAVGCSPQWPCHGHCGRKDVMTSAPAWMTP